MGRLMRMGERFPLPTLIVVLAITLLAGWHLPDLRFELSTRSMLRADSPQVQLFDEVRDTFDTQDLALVYVEDPRLFTPAGLASLRKLDKGLRALPFVSATDSVLNVPELRIENDELISSSYLPETADQAAIDAALERAGWNRFISDNLLAADGTAVAINLRLRDPGADPLADASRSRQIDQVLATAGTAFARVFQLSAAHVRNELTQRIAQDQRVILPLALGVLLLTLGLTLRRLAGVAVPLVTASLSVAWTLGGMTWLDIPLNVMTALVPALLVIVGSTEDIHLLAEYYRCRDAGEDRNGAIAAMRKNLSTAVSLTFATTYVGFLSIALNDIALLREFGLATSTGLLFNFVITLALVPALMRLLGRHKDTHPRHAADRPRRGWSLLPVFRLVHAHRRATAVILALATLVSLGGATRLQVNNNALEYFREDAPILQRIARMEDKLAGMQTFSILVSSGIEGTFRKVRYLRELEKLQRWLVSSGIADKTLSFADYLAQVHTVMDEAPPDEGHFLPDADNQVEEYVLFINHDRIAPYVNAEHSRARILVRHRLVDTHAVDAAVAAIRAYVAEHIDPGLQVAVTGEPVLAAEAAAYMVVGQAQSLVLMALVIFAIIAFMFLNPKAGLFAALANLFPVVVLFGVMGFVGVPLDSGTTMTAAITLGICVDDTMHFMVRYHQLSKLRKDEFEALQETIRDESAPIVATSLALALGFSVLAFSSFPPVVSFGLLSAMVILLALVSTLLIIPMLLSTTRLITVWDMLAVTLRDRVITNCPLFTGLHRWQVRKIVLLTQVREYHGGDYLIHHGERGDECFVVLDGDAEAVLPARGGKQIRKPIEAGDVVGEIALLAREPRTADVVAQTPVQALSLDWDSIDRLTRSYPRISAILFRNLSRILGKRLTSPRMGGSRRRAGDCAEADTAIDPAP